MSANALILRRLYRSLLKASKPFSSPNPHAAVASCLLHRTGAGDGVDFEKYLANRRIAAALSNARSERKGRSLEEARNLSKSYAIDEEPNSELGNSEDQRRAPIRICFRRLLREVVAGVDGTRQLQFPKQVDTTRLRHIIHREFRIVESPFDYITRKEVGFLALRQLNTKLSWLDTLSVADKELEAQKLRNQRQAARHVEPLPLDPDAYLRQGVFLIAHPLLTGYFRRSVVCILDHCEREVLEDDKVRHGGTYGLVINKPGLNPFTGRDQTLRAVFRHLPRKVLDSFGECSIRHGGPVHLSLQMIHGARPQDQPTLNGEVLKIINDGDTSPAMYTDRAVYYKGDLIEAASAVTEGTLDRDDISFYVGASCWEAGQLESEVKQGIWLPCRGPPEMALTGTCDHVGDDEVYTKEAERPKADLWLSLMCAMGNDEATLAHLLSADDNNENDDACDNF